MSEFLFGDFSAQETEKLFGNDKQGVKFPWGTDDCLNTKIEFGFNIPPLNSSATAAAVSFPNHSSCNDSLSHQESTSSALTSPPGSSKSSSIENMKSNKVSSHHRHNSDRKSKKKRPPNYYKQEYQQMLEASPLQYSQYQKENDQCSSMPDQKSKFETKSNDIRYISCDQWVKSTIEHQHDDKQSTNDEDENVNEDSQATTDTDNDNEPLQSIRINKIPSNNNELSVYSTSVASGASIETLKPTENLSSSSTSIKSKPPSWADLFRRETQTNNPQPIIVPQPTSSKSTNAKPSHSSTTQNGRTPSTSHYQPKMNYQVYNSNGEESKSLEDYFSKCEIRTSAMAIKPRGLINRSNYCYVNATLQALLACPAFFNVMKHIPLNDDTENHQVPCIRALNKFVNQFEKMDRTKSNSYHKDIICGPPFDPVEVLTEIARLRKVPLELVQNKQEDAHELVCQLLNEIHDEICSILHQSSSNKTDESSSTSNSSLTISDLQINGEEKAEDWLQVGKRNRTHVFRTNDIQKSLISDIFAGKIRSTVHSIGNQKSVVNEPFFTLSLDIKDSKITSVEEALLSFCESSNVADYVDSKNRRNNSTFKRMLLEHLPPILIIHLKSFVFDGKNGIKKLNRSITYSVNLILPKKILTEQAEKQGCERYKLFAVEYHQGDEATKGHYITDVFHPGFQGWLRHDDSNVYVVTSNQVVNSHADKLTPYLLFYRRGE